MTNSLRPHGHHRARSPRPSAGGRSAEPTTARNRVTQTSARRRPGRSKAVKQRDAFFDNAKYLAIVLVAMGHAWEPLTDGSRAAEALYMLVYTFHMPAFILISGYFSRSFDMRPDRLKRLVTGRRRAVRRLRGRVLALQAVGATTTRTTPISLLDPWYLTWFLVALFVWRLTTPLWRIVRWPLPLALGVAAARRPSRPTSATTWTCSGCCSSCRSSCWACA